MFQVEWQPAPVTVGEQVSTGRWLLLVDALSPASSFFAQDLTAELNSEPGVIVEVVDAQPGAILEALSKGEDVTGVVWLIPLAHAPPTIGTGTGTGSLSARTIVHRCTQTPHPSDSDGAKTC